MKLDCLSAVGRCQGACRCTLAIGVFLLVSRCLSLRAAIALSREYVLLVRSRDVCLLGECISFSRLQAQRPDDRAITLHDERTRPTAAVVQAKDCDRIRTSGQFGHYTLASLCSGNLVRAIEQPTVKENSDEYNCRDSDVVFAHGIS